MTTGRASVPTNSPAGVVMRVNLRAAVPPVHAARMIAGDVLALLSRVYSPTGEALVCQIATDAAWRARALVGPAGKALGVDVHAVRATADAAEALTPHYASPAPLSRDDIDRLERAVVELAQLLLDAPDTPDA